MEPGLSAFNQNYPNPFNTETKIVYSFKKAGLVTITIYNHLGQPVKRLVEVQKPAGQYTVLWDGRNEEGALLPGGVYFYRIQTNEFVRTNKLILAK